MTMDIDAIFPEGGTIPSIGIHIGGSSLPDVLREMMHLLRTQQRELDALRSESSNYMRRTDFQLAAHDATLHRITNDLQLDEARPLRCFRQPPQATMADAVMNIERRLARAEQKDRRESALRMGDTAQRCLQTMYFKQWQQYRCHTTSRRQLLLSSNSAVLSRYWRKWRRFIPLQTTRRARVRHVAALSLVHARHLVSLYWGKWQGALVARCERHVWRRQTALETTEALMRQSARHLVRRYLLCWQQRVHCQRHEVQRERLVFRLEQQNARRLAERYLHYWSTLGRGRRVLLGRLCAMDALRVRVSRTAARTAFAHWTFVTDRCRRRRRLFALVPHLHHASVAALARRYFGRLYAFRLRRREGMAQKALERRLGAVMDRSDGLQRQLDVGLQTLSHTNRVLAHVVDSVVIAEEPRAALQQRQSTYTDALGVEAPFAAKGSLPAWPISASSPASFPHAMDAPLEKESEPMETSATEVLRQLRSRLDKTYKSTVSVSPSSR